METTHAKPASTFGRFAAISVIVGTALYTAVIIYGIAITLNALRPLMALPCGPWLPCLPHP